LWSGIIAVGDDYIYSDTDSLKMFNYEKHKTYIEKYNAYIVRKMLLMIKYYKFNEKLLSPKTQDGNIKIIGVWDFEGTYDKFKTLGAKRYIHQTGNKIETTIAGLSKQNGVDYMIQKSNGDLNQVFKMFDDDLYIPADKTGKMTHTYVDNELKFKIVDYQGVECTVNPLTGVHLNNCEFTLSISKHYSEFLSRINKGYVFKGNKNQ
jgi:hypothetical protein